MCNSRFFPLNIRSLSAGPALGTGPAQMCNKVHRGSSFPQPPSGHGGVGGLGVGGGGGGVSGGAGKRQAHVHNVIIDGLRGFGGGVRGHVGRDEGEGDWQAQILKKKVIFCSMLENCLQTIQTSRTNILTFEKKFQSLWADDHCMHQACAAVSGGSAVEELRALVQKFAHELAELQAVLGNLLGKPADPAGKPAEPAKAPPLSSAKKNDHEHRRCRGG
jgi:hypothetical protein